ncbi:MAG: hypothetical protein AVDCRST_MAG03-3638 [uncultured Rubrobacteraceae bacterium]|uniref:Uncharacterized protein n=1 Tax=uncultured Rubrobacteraceae bacterium TaxID=349277 RepID=A0A6J4QBZ1_9ACTN|nr:MAG: hypothetical protein AVDCRST_MAG03-3638 [uncultured Rubrobacteraceae bacterium]
MGYNAASDQAESRKGALLPKVEVEGAGTFDVEEGERLVFAIEEDASVDILHRVGV